MDPLQDPTSSVAVAPPSRWARAVDGDEEAIRELTDSYWYCAYTWLRRTGFEPNPAAAAAGEVFYRGLTEPAPEGSPAAASSRMRECLATRLAESVTRGTEAVSVPAEIDATWAEDRFASEPAGTPDAIFHRRWALTVLEFTMQTVREEYAAAGQEVLFAEVAPFVGFESSNDDQYKAIAINMGLSVGAARKAVFDFRSRHREMLRAFVGDTVLDPAGIDDEITALLCACDSPDSASADTLPEAIRRLKPEQLLARAMHSVRMTSGGAGMWTPPSIEEVARLFPQYEMLGMIGRGGMGAVYQARQMSLDRFVAIKLLPLEVSVDQDFADRFVREAKTMARLNHPNIIAVYDFGKTIEGHLYFAMEYVDGENLHQMIHNHPGVMDEKHREHSGETLLDASTALSGQEPSPSAEASPTPMQTAIPNLNAERALEIISGVCEALHYAHGKGVIHRDIKPANVMVDVDGRVKVADFGLARRVDLDPGVWSRTTVGAILGTPDYMAPEQMRGANVDQRADIFSVGVVLYEMLCQKVPRGIFEPPSRRLGLDTRIDDVLTRAMQQEPERRYQHALEMKVEVDVIRNSPAPAVAVRQPSASEPPASDRKPPGSGKASSRQPAPSSEEIGSYSFMPRSAPGARTGKDAPEEPAPPPQIPAYMMAEPGAAAAAEQNEFTAHGERSGRRSRLGLWLGLLVALIILGALALVFFHPFKSLDSSRWRSLLKMKNEVPASPGGAH